MERKARIFFNMQVSRRAQHPVAIVRCQRRRENVLLSHDILASLFCVIALNKDVSRGMSQEA